MGPVEGYLIESVEGIIFDVKGLVHPPAKVIAFPRFIPSLDGLRRRGDIRYRKIYSIKERFDFLAERLPEYIVYDPVFDTKLCEVPVKRIKQIYNPVKGLERLREKPKLEDLEATALECLKILQKEANVPWNSLGISGSILTGVYSEGSDIDPVVYGAENCLKVHSALRKLLEIEDTPFKPYSLEDLRVLFDFRSKDTQMDFRDFVAVESRKAFQGKFMEKDYFIRFVKAPEEIAEQYGDIQYRNMGYAKIEAVVADASEAIFTPCIYKIEDAKVIEGAKLQPIKEISSF
ncbi:hypothetical protein H5T51_05780, partial [Candidatus Bathyarchaeota archaeon]|nr:hypothetical protein [Candidatus Bathyarchaeota archaeon]